MIKQTFVIRVENYVAILNYAKLRN